MTFDPLRAAMHRTRTGRPERAVVVPLAAARLLAGSRRAAEATPAAPEPGSVAQIGDYRAAPPRTGRPAPAAPVRRRTARTLPPAIEAHAAEIDSLLRDHLDTQLALLAEHAPELRASVDAIRTSIDLLLRLPRR